MLTPLYNPAKGQMQVAGLMSGSGTNIRKIIEYELGLQEEGASPYHLAVIFTDNAESKAVEIGRDYDLHVVVRDKRAFYKKRGKPLKDMKVRELFDARTVASLSPYGCTAAAYGGYMSIATDPLIKAFLGVNVHPADLSIEVEGKRRFTGDKAVKDAILAEERYLRSSTHIIEPVVDGGRILMISAPVKVEVEEDFFYVPATEAYFDEVATEHQNRLKEKGDWVIFPLTLRYIAEGKFSQDEAGILHFDGEAVPKGVRL